MVKVITHWGTASIMAGIPGRRTCKWKCYEMIVEKKEDQVLGVWTLYYI
jgi:hypothetical protein